MGLELLEALLRSTPPEGLTRRAMIFPRDLASEGGRASLEAARPVTSNVMSERLGSHTTTHVGYGPDGKLVIAPTRPIARRAPPTPEKQAVPPATGSLFERPIDPTVSQSDRLKSRLAQHVRGAA